MGPEWIVDQHDFTCMLPIGTAAAVMQDFYEDLAAYAAITLTPASCGYQIWLGQLLLEVVAPPDQLYTQAHRDDGDVQSVHGIAEGGDGRRVIISDRVGLGHRD